MYINIVLSVTLGIPKIEFYRLLRYCHNYIRAKIDIRHVRRLTALGFVIQRKGLDGLIYHQGMDLTDLSKI